MRDDLPARIAHDHIGLAYGAWAPTGVGGKISDEIRASWLAVLADRRITPDYAHAYDRWRSSFHAPRDRVLELELQSRLLVGHGNPSALDVGLTVHHTWGVPVIPGTALKGLLAHFVDAVYGPDDPDRPPWEQTDDERERARYQGVTWKGQRIARGPGDVYRAMFGAPDADEDEQMRAHDLAAGAQRGLVVFHDALYVPEGKKGDGPIDVSPFAIDVLTIHQKAYYDSAGKSPPNDYDAPNPVSFLSVRPGTKMLLALSGPADWTELAERLLLDALAAWGVGGKTSSGYGRLAKPGVASAVDTRDLRADAGASPARAGATPEMSRGPERSHRRGDRITVTRIEDSKGKIKFRATDGRLCHFAGEAPPEIAIGQTTEVWIANVGQDSYTLTRRQEIAAKLAAPVRGARPDNTSSTPGPQKGRRR